MSELAILGGPKTVTAPFPSWPVWDDDDRRAVMGVLESGKWWMYAYGTDEATETGAGDGQRSQVEQFEEEVVAAITRCRVSSVEGTRLFRFLL